MRKLAGGVVSPGYTNAPVPIGLTDLGFGAGGAYQYNSTEFTGTLSFATEPVIYNPGYAAFAVAPNWMAIQLNTVAVNVSVSRLASGTYWIQNVVHDNGTTLRFEDNIWNFTAPRSGMESGTILNPLGTLIAGEYYYRYGPTIAVSYPLTLQLDNSIEVVGGHPTVYFNYSVSDSSGTVSGSYDTVRFAGTVTHPPPRFEVNGFVPNGADHLDDAELTLGGDGSGQSATVLSLNATATLRYLNGASSLVNVPSAYDIGADTGETTNGLTAYYTGTTEHLDAGPALFWGLWNTTSTGLAPAAAAGWIRIGATVTPSYGSLFLSTQRDLTLSNANAADYVYLPTNASGAAATVVAPPVPGDAYELLAWADGYQNSSAATAIPVSSNATGLSVTLSPSASVLNAPVYLASYGEAQAVGAHVRGAAFSSRLRTLWLNATTVAFATPFLGMDDFDYPTFVLFSADDLNFSVRVNAFEETTSALVYVSDIGSSWSVAQWAQSYLFYGGNGTYAVTNTTLPGNAAAYHDDNVSPPAAVEFYGTADSFASHITSTEESFGVTVLNSTGTTVTDITSEAGANAVSSLYSKGLTATSVQGNGTDVYGVPSWGLYLVNSSGTRAHGLSATNDSVGIVTQNASFDASSVYALESIVIDAYNSSASSLTGLSVNDSNPAVYVGDWGYSRDVTISDASIVGTGLDLVFDRLVSITGLNVSQPNSDGVDSFYGSDGGTFRWVNATDESLGLNVSSSNDTTIDHVQATDSSWGVINVEGNNSTVSQVTAAHNSFAVLWQGGAYGSVGPVTADTGSVGVWAVGVSNVTTRYVTASDESVGVGWNFGYNVTVEGVNATSGAVGVYAQNATNLSVEDVVAEETSYPGPFAFYPNVYLELPVAAVALANDSNTSVDQVAALDYGFGVLANYSLGAMTVGNVTAWTGGFGVSLNNTNDTVVYRLFAFGDDQGVYANDSSNVSLLGSTLEDSGSYGCYALSSSNITLNANNFVGNRGASVTGRYAVGRVQAGFEGSVDVRVSSNYWSDLSGPTYSINRTTSDATPANAFLGNALRFAEVGLPSGSGWTVGVADGPWDVGYPTTDSLFYVPAWALPSGTLTYVPAAPGYDASPSTGSIDYTGQSAVVTITFNASASSGGSGAPASVLPLLMVGAGVAAVAAVVGVLLVLRARRARQDKEPQRDPNWNP